MLKALVGCDIGGVLADPASVQETEDPFEFRVLEGAVIGLRRLAAIGCRVAYVSSRRPEFRDRTELWIKRHRFPTPVSIRCLGSSGDKAAALASLGARAMIEDDPRDAEWIASHGIPVLMTAGAQAGAIKPVQGLIRVESWEQIVQWVKDHLLNREG